MIIFASYGVVDLSLSGRSSQASLFYVFYIMFSLPPLIIMEFQILVFSTVVVEVSAALLDCLFAILICSCVSCVLNAGLVRW